MYAQGFAVNYLAHAFESGVKDNGAKKTAVRSSDVFKNVLENNLRSEEIKQLPEKHASKKYTETGKNITKDGFSLKEGADAGESKKLLKADCNSDTEPVSMDIPFEKTVFHDEDDIKKGIAVECIAGLLGMEVPELIAVLQEAGIDADELLSRQGLDRLVDKLVNSLEINPEQKKMLESLLTQVNKHIEALLDDKGTALQLEPGKEGRIEVKSIVEKIIHTINQENTFNEELQTNQEGLRTDRQQIVAGRIDRSTTEAQGFDSIATGTIETEDAKYAKDIESTASEAGDSYDLKKNGNEKKLHFLEEGDGEESKGSRLPGIENANSIYGNGNQETNINGVVNFRNIVNDTALDQHSTAAVARDGENALIHKDEVISQIVNKAKIVLSEDKSEIIMHLKPDHLGKLSLKIVTEHGMVSARIVAENLQVKQILESNMQILKDSLEKQGMFIQGFSVSVNQERSQFSGGNGWNDKAGKDRKALTGIYQENTSVAEAAEIERRISPYEWNGSSIDLTA
ncbi:MAG: flagellar hook-length control protein FliK [Acetivibrionales bacterium]|jgi:flagellar hook-length control protein FliK